MSRFTAHTRGDSPAKQAAQPPSVEPHKERVLLVEDVRLSQQIAQVALRQAKFLVDVVCDGTSAIHACKTQDFDLVLMDIHLPDFSGVEATKRIRRWEEEEHKGGRRLVIFGLTGSVSKEELQAYRQAGMDGCIEKGNILGQTVRDALAEIHANPSRFVVKASGAE